MRNFIKLTTAAFVIASMASCSTDDFFGSSAENTVKKGVYVTVEDMTDEQTTRAAFDPNDGNALYWQPTDVLQVFDGALQKYDLYEFTEDNLFANKKTKSNIESVQYALFGDVKAHGWDYETDGVTADFNIPEEWEWAEAEVGENEVEAYESMLPMWGPAQEDAELGIKAKLYFLTSILKVNLENVPGNATWIGVEAYTDLSGGTPAKITGTFRAQIATGEEKATDAKLVPIDDNLYGGKIYVNVEDASRDKSVLYIPIIEGTYKLFRVKYYTDANHTVVGGTLGSYKNLKFTRGAVKPATYKAFATKGDTPTSLNQAILLKADATEPVVINATQNTQMADDDDAIYIPNMNQDLTINLQNVLKSTGKDQLIIDDNGDGFAQKLVLNIGGTASTITSIYLQVPDADVVIKGQNLTGVGVQGECKTLIIGDATEEANKTSVGAVTPEPNTGDVVINGTAASLTIPNNANTNEITINGVLTAALNVSTFVDETNANRFLTVTFGEKGEATAGVTAKCDITIPEKAKGGAISTTKSVTVNGTAASVESTGEGTITIAKGAKVSGTASTDVVKAKKGNVTIAGEVTAGNVVATAGDLTVSGEVKAGNVTATKGKLIISGTITGDATATDGDVEVARTTEGIAVSGKLSIAGESKTLTLTGGYINELTSNVTSKKELTISNTEVAPTAIKTYTNDATKIKTSTSTWCGINPKLTGDGNFSAYFNGVNIMTASEFVAYSGAADAKILANIALGTDVALNSLATVATGMTLDGNKKTISGGKITKKAAEANEGVGLFKTIAGTVKDLTIDGLKIVATSDGNTKNPVVGTLAGKGSGTINNVNVKNAVLTSDNFVVGGLVGQATGGTLTITGASQGTGKDAFTTVAADITGKNKLGGIVGEVAATTTVTITLYKAAPNFNATEVNNDSRHANTNFGTVAPFVGTAVSGGTVTVGSADDAGYKATAALTAAQRTALGFKNNWITESTNYYDFYGRKAIGWCTTTSGPSVTIAGGAAAKVDDNAKAATAAAAAALDVATATTLPLNIYVKE